ncbi:MAG: TonB-dependent receptor [Ferruginibacter sp.]|nr:TonB-dependent receptor [Ferruginibacter sp.]
MSIRFHFIFVSVFFGQIIFAQDNREVNYADTNIVKNLPDVTIVGKNSKSDFQFMPEVVGTNIYAGKKNALVIIDNVQGNVVTNNMRQIMAKVAGIHVWESDPSGIQVGISTRGLSPNRSWEFNVRQNGYDISADPFGYPEAYYNPPMQAVQRIEVVRGQGSLQYGPQFGGLVNYILRNGNDFSKPFEAEIYQSFGSNGLFGSFNAIGGKKGKFAYYGFYDHRSGDGWRKNSDFYTNAAFATVTYNHTDKISFTAEYSRSHIRSHQPGGLTDAQIKDDARQSNRSRNWFDVTWHVPAFIANVDFNNNTRWNTKLFAVIADRNSVGFLKELTIGDTINGTTLQYNNRTVTIDNYNNYGLESRFITEKKWGKIKNTISAGIRMYTGTTFRRADGKGTVSSEYNVNVVPPFPKDIHFRSYNGAAFIESIFQINENISIIPGIRYEWLKGSASGRNGFTTTGDEIILQNINRQRSFVLAGIGFEYHISKQTELYAGFTQAYRPIQFANLQAAPTTDIVDKDLKDSRGYNVDLGYRGKINNLFRFDVTFYQLQYNDRIGVISSSGNQRLITNVGSSTSRGIETLFEFDMLKLFRNNNKTGLSSFVSYSYTDARYSGAYKDEKVKGKRVENAPVHILRGGLTASLANINLTAQMSYVGKVYSDANNTELPSTNGQTGLITAYTVTDLTLQLKVNKDIEIKTGVNNLFNSVYFTRRSSGYPGPGALPADGRTFFMTAGIKL